MKIICVDKREFYLKPDSALLLRNRPYFFPDNTRDLRCQISPLIKIERLGKCIQAKFAKKYYSEMAIGIILTPVDIPINEAVCWDNTAVLSGFERIDNFDKCEYSLKINGMEIEKKIIDDWQNGIDNAIENISRNMTLRTGDIVFPFLFASEFSQKINLHDKLFAEMGNLSVETVIR
ncbi:2-hydroxyhepta-2,4-diene-1,7-dioate isomerase [Bacteroidia bacterium]|nr:2-hydroxyhepta-2,4-diene-1,7-dioate isomerase [Bacteroidia bacterium]